MYIKIYYIFGKIFDRYLTIYIHIYIWLIVTSINIQQSLVRYQTKLISNNYTLTAIFTIKNTDYDIVCKTMEKLEK